MKDVRRWMTPEMLQDQRRHILSDHFTGICVHHHHHQLHEGRDVAIFDVPAAYLNEDMLEDKFILLKIEVEFVDIMCEVNPEHKKNVRVENGVKVL